MSALFVKLGKKINSVAALSNIGKKLRRKGGKNKVVFPSIAKPARIKKKAAKKFKNKWPRRKELRHQKMLQVIKASKPSIALNVDFYRNAEGIYGSYWLGKLINTLQQGGQKKAAARQVYNTLNTLKYFFGNSPLLIFLEVLDKIKPTFRLRNYIVRRVIIKEYPIVVLRPRRLILAVHWIKEEVQAQSTKFSTSLGGRMFTLLKDFKINARKNILSKKRNEYIKRTVKAQFNIRYTFR